MNVNDCVIIDQATSTALKKAEVSEAIKRRQERFGVITADEPKVLVAETCFPTLLDSHCILFPAQESDPECWDQLCGDGREDEGEDGAVQDGG